MKTSIGVSLPAPGSRFEMSIEAIDDEGRGRGFHPHIKDAAVDVAVRGAFPGDHALVVVEKVYAKRQLLIARALTILTEGDCREPSHCSHASPCAGCPLETAKTFFALEFKKGRIRQAFDDAHISAEIEDVKSDFTHRAYRQKIKLMIEAKNKSVRLGLYRPGSHQLQSATQCALVRPALNDTAFLIQKKLNALLQQNIIKESQIPVAVFLREGCNGVGGVFVCDEKPPYALEVWLQELVDEKIVLGFSFRVRTQKSNSIVEGQTTKSFGSVWIEPIEGGPSVHVDTFCQANPVMTQRLYRDVAAFMTRGKVDGHFLDLYAGNGGFSYALIQRGAQNIHAVEAHPLCEKPLNSLDVISYIKTTEKWLQDDEQLNYDALVADPPKKGLGEVASGIAKLNIPKIALVFCNPKAITKDVEVFLMHGYSICAVVPYDLFGGTTEVETVVYLTKSCS